MPPVSGAGSEPGRAADLTRVAVYRRVVRASAERVWENVRDWEHLPWLHGRSFSSIRCVEEGAWGWRAEIGLQPAEPRRAIELELVIEPDAPRYVSRTLEGPGAGTEIWTRVDSRAPEQTAIEVEFWVPGLATSEPERRDALGRSFTALYAQLWDEDESMMKGRARELAARAESAAAPDRLCLGPLDVVRAKLPFQVELGGRRFRIARLGDALVAHAVVCPHRLGPLGDVPIDADGRITCPWHGYMFDVATGRECTGRRLRLAPAPRVRVDGDLEVWLERAR